MKSYLLIKYLLTLFKEYILILLTAIIFLFYCNSESFSEENVFTVNDVKVEGKININFKRDMYINEAFSNSFEILMSKILLSRDLKKIRNTEIKQIKNLINSFQILEESYRKEEYKALMKIMYNENKVKNFLGEKNISFSQPENISVIFFPVLFINDEYENLSENFFYNNWNNIKIKNELINYILPLENLDDLAKIIQMKNKIEYLDIEELVNKYDVRNYTFAMLDYQNSKLKVHLKLKFKEKKISKNISYNIKDITDKESMSAALKDLKFIITDIWKEENLINLLMPLSIKFKFRHKKLEDLDKLRNIFYQISIIDNSTLDEFDINNSFFKINYYGNPGKLKSELSKFGYQLINQQGTWQIFLNE